MRPERSFAGRVIFDHWPKTGGQAVNAWLRTALGTGSVSDNLIGKHRELIRQFGGEYSIISAHVEFHGEGLDPRYDYVTCFRHPVERALSWIYFVRHNFRDQDIVDLRKGVLEFLQTEGALGTEYIFSNAMTDHLCSISASSPDAPDERLKHALSVVDEYALWGLYERLPEFIGDFAAFLQVPAPPQLDNKNVTLGRPRIFEVSPSLRAKIEEMNALDIALYERLQARYDEARQRWQRPVVSVSKWQPLPEKGPRQFCSPDFALLTITREGGIHVSQNAVMTFTLEFSLAQAVDSLECGLYIHDIQGRLAFGTNSTLTGAIIGPLSAGTHAVRYTVVTALPEGKYDVGFAFIEKRTVGGRELALLDKMDFFQIGLDRHPPCEGYVSLPVTIFHRQLDEKIVRLSADCRGELLFLNPASDLAIGEQWKQSVELQNTSENDWPSFYLTPLCLSYHWLNMVGEVVELNGLRTPLPFGRLEAGKSVQMEIAVKAPGQPGRYKLQVLPVMENLAWFDALGFSPSELDIEVVSPSSTSRRYGANDCRLKSGVGLCIRGKRISDGREGFLCYGPYVPLPAGRYQIRWGGRLDPRGSEIKVDVVANVGMSLLARQSVPQACTEVALEVEVRESVADAECRVWVSAGAEAELAEIVIEPLADAGRSAPPPVPVRWASAGQPATVYGADSDSPVESTCRKRRWWLFAK